MGLFGKRPPSRYIAADALERMLRTQLASTPQTMAELSRHGVTPATQLRLEYFFYTNSKTNAGALAQALLARQYTGEARLAADGSGDYVINGWTTRMAMDLATVSAWTEEMCRLGFTHDCEFDGWGTNPRQAADWKPDGA